jgi:hypothetical protein
LYFQISALSIVKTGKEAEWQLPNAFCRRNSVLKRKNEQINLYWRVSTQKRYK